MQPDTVQITHKDLDGYGASTVAGLHRPVSRVEHVMRYSDVDAIVRPEIERLKATSTPGLLLSTDVGIETGFAGLIRAFARMTAKAGVAHRLLVLDHHASSVDVLRDRGMRLSDGQGPLEGCVVAAPPEATAAPDPRTGLPHVAAVVDVSRCATRLTHDLSILYADPSHDPLAAAPDPVVELLVRAVDAVDLWRRDAPDFHVGEILNEAFWETVSTFVPMGHRLHDRLMSRTLLAVARQATVLSVAGVEDALGATRRGATSSRRCCARTATSARPTPRRRRRACACPATSPRGAACSPTSGTAPRSATRWTQGSSSGAPTCCFGRAEPRSR